MAKVIGSVLTLAILAGVVYLCIAEAASGTDDGRNGIGSGSDGGTATTTTTTALKDLREATGRAPEIDRNPDATSTLSPEDRRAYYEEIKSLARELLDQRSRELDEKAARGPPKGVIPKKTKITLDVNATAPQHKCRYCPNWQVPRMCRLHQWEYLVDICKGRIYQYEGVQTYNDYWNDNNHEELLSFCCRNPCDIRQYAEMCEYPDEVLGKPDPKLVAHWKKAFAKAKALEEKARLEKEEREKNASTSTTAQP